MVIYRLKNWNGIFRLSSKKRIPEIACEICEYRENKRTGTWRSDLTVSEIENYLKETTGDPSAIIMRKNGSKGEMTAMVPVDVHKLHTYVSLIQAKQQMETCGGCGALLNKIAGGEIPVKDDFAIA